MRIDLALRGGTVVFPDGIRIADLGISGGKIVAIDAVPSADSELNVTGLHILPGAIDTQVHFREPGMEHKEDIESGTRAAMMGGVTTIFEMPNTNPLTTSAATLQNKLDRANGRAWCHYAFFVGSALDNIDQLDELEMLAGSPGIKTFMGSSTGNLLIEDDDTLIRVLQHGKKRCSFHSEDEPRLRARKSLISDHPHPREHPFLRDAEAARLSTERLLRASKATGRPVHVLHISTLDELPLLAAAKRDGLGTTCEVTPQHLSFNDELYERIGTLAQMNPPVRSETHRAAIFKAFQDGLFDVIGSDHAPHTLEEKAQPYPRSPSGMPGVETLLPVMLNLAARGDVSLETIVKMTSQRPAELFGVKSKGQVALGYDADLAIVDLKHTWTVEGRHLQSKCGWTPFEGMQLTGRVEHVIVNGLIAVRERERILGPQGRQVEFDWK